ncbi:zona pellucida sperm-binding protein 3 [Parambassis ranga]|uniref:Zona pellucida sperm-binding protein 3 n=1 Tax=Parambassis ranga TaxID=210632 RepID=A0A6P7HMK1_9TELE|nr:zona pellucida sperm-binding protein 3-like [Parambassis ranga]
MKTKWHLFFLWSVLSLGLLSSAVDTYESAFTGRKKLLKLSTQKFNPVHMLTAGVGRSRQKSPSSPSPPAPLGSLQGSHPPHTPGSTRPEKPRAKIRSAFAYLPDASVACSAYDFVVRVKPTFYGLGADADELKLGSSCKSNGVLRPYGDLLFTYPLTACDGVRELLQDHLVYKYVLHYKPSPNRFPSRAHPFNVDIECRFQRDHHVYQLAVRPTWGTVAVRKRLNGRPSDFQIQLMDDAWDRPAMSPVYQLGQTVNFQVSALHLPAGGKLYISSCSATPRVSKSSLKYTIIDNSGCMLDSKRNHGTSQFISRTDKTLRWSLNAFQFAADPDTEVSIHCTLFVTSEALGPAQKSCTYRGDRWRALTGDDSICKCCESQCVASKPRRVLVEGFASSGPLLVSDQPHTAEDGFMPVTPSVDVVEYDGGSGKEEDEQLEGRSPVLDLNQLSSQEKVSEGWWEESEVKSLSEFEEDSSAYEEWDYSEGEMEGGDAMISEQMIHVTQKEGEVPHHQAQPPDSKDGHLEEEKEMTWYFTWR